jgi:hypothetical protein
MNFTTQKSICAQVAHLIRQYAKDNGNIAGNLWHSPKEMAAGSRKVAVPYVNVTRFTTRWSDAK